MFILIEALKGGMVRERKRKSLFSLDRRIALLKLNKTSTSSKKKKKMKAELRDCPDFSTRLSTAARHAKLIAEDLAGQVALIPFALRALSERSRAKREGRLLVGLRYGPRERQVADLWLPGAAAGEKREKGQRPPAIAVLFHGGTWTAGDKVSFFFFFPLPFSLFLFFSFVPCFLLAPVPLVPISAPSPGADVLRTEGRR